MRSTSWPDMSLRAPDSTAPTRTASCVPVARDPSPRSSGPGLGRRIRVCYRRAFMNETFQHSPLRDNPTTQSRTGRLDSNRGTLHVRCRNLHRSVCLPDTGHLDRARALNWNWPTPSPSTSSRLSRIGSWHSGSISRSRWPQSNRRLGCSQDSTQYTSLLGPGAYQRHDRGASQKRHGPRQWTMPLTPGDATSGPFKASATSSAPETAARCPMAEPQPPETVCAPSLNAYTTRVPSNTQRVGGETWTSRV